MKKLSALFLLPFSAFASDPCKVVVSSVQEALAASYGQKNDSAKVIESHFTDSRTYKISVDGANMCNLISLSMNNE